MKVELCHTISTETIELNLPDQFVNDLEHVVVLHDGEAFQLKSMIPDEVKGRNKLRKDFEDREFEGLRTEYYRDLNEDSDPDEFEKDFTEKIKGIIFAAYPDLDAIANEAMYHTICVHFVIYAVYKNRAEKLEAKNNEQKSDKNYAKDYAKRLINLFKILDLREAGSIRKFSEELNTLEKFMQGDTRRHAGYDKLFAGIHFTVQQLAKVFINNDVNTKINLVKAFEDAANGEDNEDRKKLIASIDDITNLTIKYYNDYIANIDKTEYDISVINSDLSLAYLTVGQGLVAKFINDTDKFLGDSGTEKDSVKLSELRKEYKKKLEMFCNYFDDLIAAFDDVTNNITPDSVFATNLNYIWFNMNKYRSSESETWPSDLAKLLFDNYNELFKDVPQYQKKENSSN